MTVTAAGLAGSGFPCRLHGLNLECSMSEPGRYAPEVPVPDSASAGFVTQKEREMLLSSFSALSAGSFRKAYAFSASKWMGNWFQRKSIGNLSVLKRAENVRCHKISIDRDFSSSVVAGGPENQIVACSGIYLSGSFLRVSAAFWPIRGSHSLIDHGIRPSGSALRSQRPRTPHVGRNN